MTFTLYEHQKKQKKKTYQAIQEGHKSILNVLATGGGKTIIFSDIAKDAMRRHQLTWILTHREEIRLQTIEKLYKFGMQPGQIASGRPITSNRVQVASVQTLANMVDNMHYIGMKPDWIITDECHHAIAPTWSKILDKFPDAIKLGFTATPSRMDGIGLGNIYTEMIEGKQSAWLVENDFLTAPLVFSSSAALEMRKQKFKIKNNEFDLKAQTQVLGQKAIVQDTVNCYRKFFNGAPAIIFCASIADCATVCEAMNNDGWKCGVVESGMDSDLRRDYITGLGTGKYNAICSYDVIGEGVDIPVLAGIIMRRLTKSLVIYLQQVGRALRKFPGKKHGLIIDQAGNYYIHGHPLEHRYWNLNGKALRTSENEIKTKECPNLLCRAFLTGNPSVCPYCGMHLNDTSQNARQSKELKIVNAELLQVQSPIYANQKAMHEPQQNDVLLDKIVNDTFNEIEDSRNSIESRFDFLMNNMKNSNVNKIWSKS